MTTGRINQVAIFVSAVQAETSGTTRSCVSLPDVFEFTDQFTKHNTSSVISVAFSTYPDQHGQNIYKTSTNCVLYCFNRASMSYRRYEMYHSRLAGRNFSSFTAQFD
jgi:hypothetical protein